mmetsp:Transcript_15935/g.38297  ORF Transcript_15935/g.38297 Transcript_15935/m.38297 type:complete len:264 (+) Transcript_15935:68-859(+)
MSASNNMNCWLDCIEQDCLQVSGLFGVGDQNRPLYQEEELDIQSDVKVLDIADEMEVQKSFQELGPAATYPVGILKNAIPLERSLSTESKYSTKSAKSISSVSSRVSVKSLASKLSAKSLSSKMSHGTAAQSIRTAILAKLSFEKGGGDDSASMLSDIHMDLSCDETNVWAAEHEIDAGTLKLICDAAVDEAIKLEGVPSASPSSVNVDLQSDDKSCFNIDVDVVGENNYGTSHDTSSAKKIKRKKARKRYWPRGMQISGRIR